MLYFDVALSDSEAGGSVSGRDGGICFSPLFPEAALIFFRPGCGGVALVDALSTDASQHSLPPALVPGENGLNGDIGLPLLRPPAVVVTLPALVLVPGDWLKFCALRCDEGSGLCPWKSEFSPLIVVLFVSAFPPCAPPA